MARRLSGGSAPSATSLLPVLVLVLASCTEGPVQTAAPVVPEADAFRVTTGPADWGVLGLYGTPSTSRSPDVPLSSSASQGSLVDPYIVEWAGLEWVWASPCSGGCSQLVEPIPFGFRFATDAEMQNIPPAELFGPIDKTPIFANPPAEKCAAFLFDDRYSHCDMSNYLPGQVTSKPNGSYWETLLVRGDAPSNQPPVADASRTPTVVECTDSEATPVVLDGSASFDPDGSIVAWQWSANGESLGSGEILNTTLGLGSHTITLTVTDDDGAQSSTTVTVDVVDTTPPTVSAAFERLDEGDDSDEDGRFRIVFSCSDGCDVEPSVTAEVNGVSVPNGQIADLEIDDDADAEFEDGVLTIEAPEIVLKVTCTDASGNSTVVEVTAPLGRPVG